MQKKIRVLVIDSILIILAIIGITLALSYIMDSTDIDIDLAKLALNYTGDKTLPSNGLLPINDSEASYNTTNSNLIKLDFSVKGTSTNPNKQIVYDIIIDNINLPCSFRNELVKWKLFKNTTLFAEGNFSPTFDIIENNQLYLTTIQQDLPKSNETADSYELLIWISEACQSNDITSCTNLQDQSEIIGKTISGNIQILLYTDDKVTRTRKTGEVLTCNSAHDTSGANAPVLVEGLIPVAFDEENNLIKADSLNKQSTWYSYSDKRWANAVLVSSTKRATYQNAQAGSIIQESDVLAYYVWIPRYKYKVWNINKVIGTDSYNAKETGIDIIFETKKTTTGTIKCNYDFTITDGSLSEICLGSNGDYYTHPAFTFGNIELPGFWIGKFEISSEDPTIQYGGGTSETITPRILPSVKPWYRNQLTNFYKVIYDMQKDSNVYGLNTSRTNTDSHMIKNIEWGAVAYLSNSNYGKCKDGICTKITINQDEITGGENYKVNTEQSTTGNIYGVYDMAAGNDEVTMSNVSSTAGSYEYYARLAGTNFSYEENTKKYIDTYAYGITDRTQEAYNRTRLGDAIGEVALIESSYKGGWYNVSLSVAFSTNPWITRGLGAWSGYPGIFASSYHTGENNSGYTTHAILASLTN